MSLTRMYGSFVRGLPISHGAKVKLLSNNPFKMIGPWIGALPGMVLIFLTKTTNRPACDFALCMSPESSTTILYIFSTIILIIGFLLGWGIHALIRRLRR